MSQHDQFTLTEQESGILRQAVSALLCIEPLRANAGIAAHADRLQHRGAAKPDEPGPPGDNACGAESSSESLQRQGVPRKIRRQQRKLRTQSCFDGKDVTGKL
jgi:hypothetical protein